MLEDLKQYVTTEKIGDCWRCGEKFTISDLRGTKSNPELICSRCGLIIEVTSRVNRWISYSFLIGISSFAFGWILALLLF